MEREKKKRAMIAGMVSMAIFMAGDWFWDVKGSGNEEIGIFVNSNWTTMSMWRFEVSILLAAIAMPLYWIALRGLRCLVAEKCEEDPQGHAGVMNRVFQISSAADFTNQVGMYILVPFMVYYLVADIGMSVVIVYLIFTGRFALPKWMAFFQPAGGLLLSEIFMRIPRLSRIVHSQHNG